MLTKDAPNEAHEEDGGQHVRGSRPLAREEGRDDAGERRNHERRGRHAKRDRGIAVRRREEDEREYQEPHARQALADLRDADPNIRDDAISWFGIS